MPEYYLLGNILHKGHTQVRDYTGYLCIEMPALKYQDYLTSWLEKN
jgi:hypothetical protein